MLFLSPSLLHLLIYVSVFFTLLFSSFAFLACCCVSLLCLVSFSRLSAFCFFLPHFLHHVVALYNLLHMFCFVFILSLPRLLCCLFPKSWSYSFHFVLFLLSLIFFSTPSLIWLLFRYPFSRFPSIFFLSFAFYASSKCHYLFSLPFVSILALLIFLFFSTPSSLSAVSSSILTTAFHISLATISFSLSFLLSVHLSISFFYLCTCSPDLLCLFSVTIASFHRTAPLLTISLPLSSSIVPSGAGAGDEPCRANGRLVPRLGQHCEGCAGRHPCPRHLLSLRHALPLRHREKRA